MAAVPYDGGVPEVAPTPKPPDDYQHINVTPDMFGAQVGQGLQQLGAGATTAGRFYGEVAADNQSNEYQTRIDRILHGDPSKMVTGPDGQQHPDTGFLGLHGRDAMDARPQVIKQMEDTRNDLRGQLGTPEQQLKFDNFSRRYQSYATGQIGTHADSQATTWYQKVNTDSASLGLTHIANNADNPEMVAAGASDVIAARVKQAEIAGAKPGDPVWTEAVTSAKRDALTAQLNAIAVKDPARAMRMLDKNKDVAGLNYDNLAREYRSRSDAQIGREAGAGAMSSPTNSKSPLEIASKFVGAEEHTNRGTISAFIGSVGGQRVDPATTAWCAGFVNAVLRESGLQGTDSLAARSFLNVGQPVYGDPQQGDVVVFSRGNDPTKGHVAFYAGPGSTPGTVKVLGGNQGNQVSYAEYPASSIVGVRRMSAGDMGKTPQADIASPQLQKADALNRLLSSPEYKALTPEQQTHATAYIEQQARLQEVAAASTARARKEANDKAADTYVTDLLSGKAVDLNAIANDKNLEYTTKMYLTNAVETHTGDDYEKAKRDYGAGFWPALKSIQAPAGDPDRINDYSQLLGRTGKDVDQTKRLTLSGVQKLNEVMTQNRKSVDAQSVNTTKMGMFNYAKGQLSFEQDTGPVKIRDPKGEAIFNAQFIPKFESAYTQWVKDGKDPYQFLTKENVDKLMVGMRSKSEMQMERMAATGEQAPGDPKAPLPEAPKGVDAATWKSVMQNRPVTENGTPFSSAAWATAVNLLLADPANVARFNNSKFGKAGFDGAKILEQLKPKAAPALPQIAPEAAAAAAAQ